MKKVALVVLLGACIVSAALFSACDDDDVVPVTAGDAAADNNNTSSSSSSSSGGPLDAATACAAYAEAVCTRFARCSPLLIDVGFGNLDACKEGTTTVCNRWTSAPGAAPFSASCIDALATGCGMVDFGPASECASKGSLADGVVCEFDGQCASGRCGGAGGPPGCGLCKAASDAASFTAAGGSCDNEGDCEQGLACLGASTSTSGQPIMGTCQKMRQLGEACTDAEDCNTGSHGDFGWMSFTVACLDGGCAKPLDEGATCKPALQYQHSCDVQKKLRCDLLINDAGFSGECRKWPFAKAGEPCTANNQTPSGTCLGDNRCVVNADAGPGGKAGTCIPKAPVGSPCTIEYDCRFGLACVNGACAILPSDRCK